MNKLTDDFEKEIGRKYKDIYNRRSKNILNVFEDLLNDEITDNYSEETMIIVCLSLSDKFKNGSIKTMVDLLKWMDEIEETEIESEKRKTKRKLEMHRMLNKHRIEHFWDKDLNIYLTRSDW